MQEGVVFLLNSATDIWAGIIKILERDLTPTAINTWFDNCQVVDLKDNLLVLYTPTSFKKDIILSRYADKIKSALFDIFSGDFDLLVLCENELETYRKDDEGTPQNNPFDGSQFTFERFVVGTSNRFAHAAAMAVAQNPSSSYNPLFIYGESGLGKTHLLYAIGHVIKTSHPSYRIVYVKGDDFTNELISAIQTGKNIEFREKYRQADLFLVDDIQFIAGKVQTQEEFFHTFNTLYEAGKQIVLTSDRPPMEMLRLEDRLKSRFEWGLLADIQPPDYETRVAIVKNKAQRMGIALPDKISYYIAENITTNIRQIEGTVKKIMAYRDLLNNNDIDMELVERITKDIIRGEREYTPELIIERTASYYSLSTDEIIGKSRSKNTALARQISMYLMRKLTNMPLADIGVQYGNKDHSTVLHAIRKIEDNMTSSPELTDIIRDITSNITSKR
jgi:chromosomal replication initiator protein